ncbi:MAG: enoyl-CoA hydratase-related protein [Pseudomonadota bacterium]
MTTSADTHIVAPTSLLDVAHAAGVVTISFARPEARNALTDEMTEGVIDVLRQTAEDRSVRVIVLRGHGGVFCAGGDLKGFRANMQGNQSRADVAAMNRRFGALMEAVNTQPQVVIVLVEGAAIGGGLGLACVGDVTLTTRDAKFQLTETRLGIPPAQIAPFVVARVGLTAARRIMLTGASFDGATARSIGIAHESVASAADLQARCDEIIADVLMCGPYANAVTKSILMAAQAMPLDDALDFAAKGFADCMLSDEAKSGIQAFIDKRSPRWVDDA